MTQECMLELNAALLYALIAATSLYVKTYPSNLL